MRLHPNAKTTPTSRSLLVRRVLQEHRSVSEVARGLGVSPRTVYKWLRRFEVEGRRGLRDRSSQPHRIPHRTPPARERAIERLRRRRWLAWRIARRLQMALSTVSAVLRRLGLGRLPSRRQAVPVRRYQWEHPGDLLHIDVKKLGRFREVGHRVTGKPHDRSHGMGWEYAYVCVDDATRLAYVELLENEQAVTAEAFLRRAVRWYRSRHVRARRVMTDNGSPFVSNLFAEACTDLGLRHIRTRPYTPRTNGKAERFIQTLQREWAYGKTYQTSAGRKRALPAWLRYYNEHRPHRALGMEPPGARLQQAL
jgi:transposase InsO family protein